jgi:16S rRNA (guanine(966)-N(2))-methyltransferase RsmD
MRVTGGSARGRALSVPPGTRPMTARMREALFVILGGVLGGIPGGIEGGVKGHSFLDLFAGSGLLSAEAASRAANPIVAVERDARKRRTIKANLAAVDARATVVTAPAERFITMAGRREQRFDVICVDPPYAYRHKQELLTALAQAELLAASGCLVLHCPASDPIDPAAVPLTLVDSRRYGQSALMLFRP